MFKNASDWKEIASPPNEIIRQQIEALIARETHEEEISKQPFVISKKPKISPFESAVSSPMLEKRREKGLKNPRSEKTSVAMKKIVINPPTSKIELTPSSIVFERSNSCVSCRFELLTSISFGEYFR